MKERTITDVEFINITVKVMDDILLIEDTEVFKAYSILFSSMVCAELFGAPDEEDEIPFETVFKACTKNYTYAIYHGGSVVGNRYVVRVEEPNCRLVGEHKYFDTLEDAYKCLIYTILELS